MRVPGRRSESPSPCTRCATRSCRCSAQPELPCFASRFWRPLRRRIRRTSGSACRGRVRCRAHCCGPLECERDAGRGASRPEPEFQTRDSAAAAAWAERDAGTHETASRNNRLRFRSHIRPSHRRAPDRRRRWASLPANFPGARRRLSAF